MFIHSDIRQNSSRKEILTYIQRYKTRIQLKYCALTELFAKHLGISNFLFPEIIACFLFWAKYHAFAKLSCFIIVLGTVSPVKTTPFIHWCINFIIKY